MIAADDFYVLELRKKRREDSLLKLRTGMNDDSWLCVCEYSGARKWNSAAATIAAIS